MKNPGGSDVREKGPILAHSSKHSPSQKPWPLVTSHPVKKERASSRCFLRLSSLSPFIPTRVPCSGHGLTYGKEVSSPTSSCNQDHPKAHTGTCPPKGTHRNLSSQRHTQKLSPQKHRQEPTPSQVVPDHWFSTCGL